MKIFDDYGLKMEVTDRVADRIGTLLGVKFIPRTGHFSGDHYSTTHEKREEFDLVPNFFAGEWRNEDYKDYPWLLEGAYLETPDAAMKLLLGVAGIDFLRRTEIDDHNMCRDYVYRDGTLHLVDEYPL